MGAFSAHAGQGATSLYAKGCVVRLRFGAIDIRVHEFLRIMCICYVTLGCYHIRWWYWSKKQCRVDVNGRCIIVSYTKNRIKYLFDFFLFSFIIILLFQTWYKYSSC